MKFDQIRPCGNCPFRTDVLPYLTQARAREISSGITREQKTFTCHKTLHRDGYKGEEQHCAGALIVLEKMNLPNQMMRIAERLNMYNRFKLDMESPVFDNTKQFIKAQSNGIRQKTDTKRSSKTRKRKER
jgi:hypothetical protein